LAGVAWIHRPIGVARSVDQAIAGCDIVVAHIQGLVTSVFRAVKPIVARVRALLAISHCVACLIAVAEVAVVAYAVVRRVDTDIIFACIDSADHAVIAILGPAAGAYIVLFVTVVQIDTRIGAIHTRAILAGLSSVAERVVLTEGSVRFVVVEANAQGIACVRVRAVVVRLVPAGSRHRLVPRITCPVPVTAIRIVTVRSVLIATCRAVGLESIDRATSCAVAELWNVTRTGVGAALDAWRFVVRLAGTCAVAGVGVVAYRVARIAAGRARRLEPVDGTTPRAVAELWDITLTRVGTAHDTCWLMVGLAGARTVAGVRVVALRVARIAAGRAVHHRRSRLTGSTHARFGAVTE